MDWRGIYFRFFSAFVSSFLFFLPLLAFWLLGFLGFWLLGFLAFRLLVGLCGFWWLFGCIASSSAFRWFMQLFASSASQFLSGRFGFCTLSLVFWIWLPASSASPVFSLFESSLLRSSWGGLPPTHLLLFRLFVE